MRRGRRRQGWWRREDKDMGILAGLWERFANWVEPSGIPTKPLINRGSQSAKLFRGNGLYDFEVVGEASYQTEISEICGGKSEDGHEFQCAAALIFDDRNEFDPDAVAVGIAGRLVGYLSRDAAKEFRRQVTNMGLGNVPMGCRAVIRGGWDRGDGDTGHFGVWLDLARPLSVEN